MYLFPLSSAPRWPLGGAGNRVGPGAQKGYEGLDGARTEFSFVPLRIPPLSRPVCPGRGDEPARKSSQSPWRESGCMILIIVITVVRPGPFKVFLSLYLCTEGKGAKMEKGCGGRDKAPPQQGAGVLPPSPPCSPPPRASCPPWRPASPTIWLLFAVTVPGLAPGSPREETPWLEFPSG